MIDIKDLQAFVAIINSGSLSQAALDLELTQPALSQKLKRLETAFGLKLFERTPRQMVPLEAAKFIEPLMREILLKFQILQESLTISSTQIEGTVHIGSVMGWVSALLLPAVKTMHQRAPRLKLKISIEQRERLLPMLLHGQIDLIIIPEGSEKSQGIETEELLNEGLVLISSDYSLLQFKEKQELKKELLSRPWITMTLPDPLVDRLWSHEFQEDFPWRQVSVPLQLNHIQNLASLVEMIPGSICILPKQTAWPWILSKKLTPIFEEKASNPLQVAWREGAMVLKRYAFAKEILQKEAENVSKMG